LKYPKDKKVPELAFPAINSFYKEAIDYVQNNFSNNYGIANLKFVYPINFTQSKQWLHQFLTTRFAEFGEYEDAIVDNEYVLHHSVLTPILNVGLITPQQVINEILDYAVKHNISMNSTEGLIRQIIGWREFIRAVYEQKGTQERNTNFWKFTKKIPPSFWTGTTGIEPVDIVIKKVLTTGYCHHIERLMVLGNFMLLCEFDPNEVYKWFMEMFIDAYDWVMVTNVYGMSQFADGGLMATKPYISGSNYLMKMSNFKKGNWQTIWDGLFWRFMHVHRDFLLSNPRLRMLINTFDKMAVEKRENHLKVANKYLLELI
jgi:deoxyribodipyrimidine photolyase-related protein